MKPKKRKDSYGKFLDDNPPEKGGCIEYPRRSKSDEAFYKTCQATQDGTLLKEFDKVKINARPPKRSKELEEMLREFGNGWRRYLLGIGDVRILEKAITAIEKWAKERYGREK